MRKIPLAIISSVILSACSNQDFYQSAQRNQQQQCAKENPSHHEYEECLRRSEQTYKEYKEERERIVSEKD